MLLVGSEAPRARVDVKAHRPKGSQQTLSTPTPTPSQSGAIVEQIEGKPVQDGAVETPFLEAAARENPGMRHNAGKGVQYLTSTGGITDERSMARALSEQDVSEVAGPAAGEHRVAVVFGSVGAADTAHLPGALRDADRAAAFYEALHYDVQIVKDPTVNQLQAWLSIGGWGLGPGDSFALYFAGAGSASGLYLPGADTLAKEVGLQAFEDAIRTASASGASASVVLDSSFTDALLDRPVHALDTSGSATRGDGASTGSSASAEAQDAQSTTQTLLEIAAFAPHVPLDELLGQATERDRNRGGRARLGERRADDANRRALVIGNGAYASASLLPGAARDAAGMAGLLAGRGYEVQICRDAGGAEMYDALQELASAAQPGDDCVIYYAGHGVPQGWFGSDGAVLGTGDVHAVRDGITGGGGTCTVIADACYSDSLHAEATEGGRPEEDPAALEQARKNRAMDGELRLPQARATLEAELSRLANRWLWGPTLAGVAESARALDEAARWADPEQPEYTAMDRSEDLVLRTVIPNLEASMSQVSEGLSRNALDEADLRAVVRDVGPVERALDLQVPGRETLTRLADADETRRRRLLGPSPEKGWRELATRASEAVGERYAERVRLGEGES